MEKEKFVGGMHIPIYARKLQKSEIILKRDQKTNWGRFLDNHYNPSLHGKAFTIAMKAPDSHYKYSLSGLSHNYKMKNILEKLTVEEQTKLQKEKPKFKEIELLRANDIIIFIEFRSNNERTQLSTRHIEEKYESFARRFKQGILEKFPSIKVYIKSQPEDEKVIKYSFK